MGNIFSNGIIILLISMIWGFALALFFRKTCKNDQCVVVKVPPEFYQSGNIIYDAKSNRCYQLHAYPSECVY